MYFQDPADSLYSEGEVLRPSGPPPEADPLLALLQLHRQQENVTSVRPAVLHADPHQEMALGVDQSLGEVSIGQRPHLQQSDVDADRYQSEPYFPGKLNML